MLTASLRHPARASAWRRTDHVRRGLEVRHGAACAPPARCDRSVLDVFRALDPAGPVANLSGDKNFSGRQRRLKMILH
jgi:hypothetical protein